MAIIPCAEKCRYQKDGYCGLEQCAAVNSAAGVCPYFVGRSTDVTDRVGQPFDPDQPDGIGAGRDLL